MPLSLGKGFESQFKTDIKNQGMFIYRLPDQMTGNAVSSKNPCDFIVYTKPYLYMVECKSIHGNTFPLSNLTQYELLKSYNHFDGLNCAVLIWYIDKDKLLYVPISTVQLCKKKELKSINVTKLEELEDKYIEVPFQKKRIYLSGNYEFLKTGVNI